MNSIRPAVSMGAHPIETTKYLLETPVIFELKLKVYQWIDNRVPGGMIYGRPRFGKTRAIKYLERLLPDQYGQMPILVLLCREYRLASESAFFEDLLRASGHAIVTQGRTSQKRDRLREFWIEKVELSGQNRLVLFVDEAQKLHEHQYKWLIDIHNELDREGISLIVLLVGQQELMHQFSAFQMTKKTQIIGRFMVHQTSFRGLRSIRDITSCLKIYDEYSEYPDNSKFTFTQYFFPIAYRSGWRLYHYANELWQAFIEIKEEQHIAKSAELPMQYLCRTIEYVLRRYGNFSEDADPISLNMWKESIENSGYVDTARSFSSVSSDYD